MLEGSKRSCWQLGMEMMHNLCQERNVFSPEFARLQTQGFCPREPWQLKEYHYSVTVQYRYYILKESNWTCRVTEIPCTVNSKFFKVVMAKLLLCNCMHPTWDCSHGSCAFDEAEAVSQKHFCWNINRSFLGHATNQAIAKCNSLMPGTFTREELKPVSTRHWLLWFS